MTIYQGSRYEYSAVDFVSKTADGNNNAIVFYENTSYTSLAYFDYTVIDGDRLDQIAYKFFRKMDLWWYILDNNPQIFDPFNLDAGTVIRIPRE